MIESSFNARKVGHIVPTFFCDGSVSHPFGEAASQLTDDILSSKRQSFGNKSRKAKLNSLLLGALVFFILILATMLGMFARMRLPEHHLNSESKDVIRLATAVVGTLSALALGLLIASAKSDYDDAQAEMKTSAARIVLLDRIMARYGPETEHPRAVLKQIIQKRLDQAWNAERADELSDGALPEFKDIEDIQASLRALNPTDAAQSSLKHVRWKSAE